MSDTIIKVENLSKSYLIGHERQQGYVALRDVVSNKAKGFLKGIKNIARGKELIGGQEIEEFWALKDINFEIKKGDAVGIIGRNGAGKSTLLKILSRITEPTKGRIELNGRVASLLEVGTGFHPELSGRENIYLNGAILGMSRAEIKSKFDEIVEFSGVEKFLDTPVKRYSSGMYVRLAFAVAAHLEPEILVVDEVLAVGDAEFQKKCLGKMDDVAKAGRTVLFVSHQLGTISQLCKNSILMEKGTIKFYGPTENAIQLYTSGSDTSNYVSKDENKSNLFFKNISLTNTEGVPTTQFVNDEDIIVKFKLSIKELDAPYTLFVSILNQNKVPVFSAETKVENEDISLIIENNFLTQGNYSIKAILHHAPIKQTDYIEDNCLFSVIDKNSDFIIYNNHNYNYGNVFGKYSWRKS